MSRRCTDYVLDYISPFTVSENSKKICVYLVENEFADIKNLKKALRPIKNSELQLNLEMLINKGFIKEVDSNNAKNEQELYYDLDYDNIFIGLYEMHLLNYIEINFEDLHLSIIKLILQYRTIYVQDMIVKLIESNIIPKSYEYINGVLNILNKFFKDTLFEVAPVFAKKYGVDNREIRLINVERAVNYFVTTKHFNLTNNEMLTEDEISWNLQLRLNHEQVSLKSIQYLILDSVKVRFENLSYILLMGYFIKAEENNGSCLTITELRAATNDTLNDPMNESQFNDHLSELIKYGYFQQLETAIGTSIDLNLSRVVQSLVNDHIGKVIHNKFSSLGLSIWHYVLSQKYVEESDLLNHFSNHDKNLLQCTVLDMMNFGVLYKHEVARKKKYLNEKLEMLYHINMPKVVDNMRYCVYRLLLNNEDLLRSVISQRTALINKIYSIHANGELTADIEGEIPLVTDIEKKELDKLNNEIFKCKFSKFGNASSLLLFNYYLKDQWTHNL